MSDVLKENEKFNYIDEKDISNKVYNDFKKSEAFVITNAKKEFEGKKDNKQLYWRNGGSYFQPYMRFGGFGASYASASSSSSQSFGLPSQVNFLSDRSFSGKRPALRPKTNHENTFNSLESYQNLNGNYESSRPAAPKFEVRKVFPETWIFDSFDMPIK